MTAVLVAACSLLVGAAQAEDGSADADVAPLWSFQLYSDIGHAASDNEPANRDWRSKSTTARLDDLELFLAMGNVRKLAAPESRWGFQLGLQTGLDSEGLIPGPSDEPLPHADELRHFYRANVSYLFNAGRGVQLTAGLMNSRVGWESFLAIDNPNYTRSYGIDNVAYFLVGVETMWDVSETVDLGFYLVTGWNYLSDINDAPGYGLYVEWKISPSVTFTQNVYLGPEQKDTSFEFWRYFSDTIVEWRRGRFLLAAVVDVGAEKQATVPGHTRDWWASGVLIAQWQLSKRWSVAFRPELYWDEDGLLTSARQNLQAYTATVKYEYAPRQHRLVGTLEARYDNSTGEDGGFYAGSANVLVPDQFLVLGGVLWSFDGWP